MLFKGDSCLNGPKMALNTIVVISYDIDMMYYTVAGNSLGNWELYERRLLTS
jgi:hypothetical protein